MTTKGPASSMAQPNDTIGTKGTVDCSLNTGACLDLILGPKRGTNTENEAGPGPADTNIVIVSISAEDSMCVNAPSVPSRKLTPLHKG